MDNPTYYELLELNPLLAKRTPEEVSELILTMNECNYEWNNEIMRFHNYEYQNSIRTEGIDHFTAESFKIYYKNLIDKVNLDPDLYERTNKAEYMSKLATYLFLIIFLLLITVGWFFFSFYKILQFIVIMIIIWIGLFARFLSLSAKERKLKGDL
jgi:hypothetical protein